MNSEMGLSSKPRRLMALIGRPHDARRGARHWARISRRTLHMRAIGVKRAFHCLIELAPVALFGLRASPRSFFSQLDINYLPMWALWSCGRRACVVQAQRQIHRAFAGHLDRRWPDNASSPLDHRAIRATSGVDKLKRDRGSEGARPWGASSRRKLRGTIKIVIFRRALPLSNPWLEPIVDCGFRCPQNLTSGRRSQSGWHHNCKFRSFRQAISVQTGRRFRWKPTGRFGPKRHPVADGFWSRLWRTAAARYILPCSGLPKQVLLSLL